MRSARSRSPKLTRAKDPTRPGLRSPGFEAVLVGVDDGVDAVADTQLHQDPADVRLDRRLGDDEGVGDLGVGQSASDQLQRLALALGERRKGAAVGRAYRRAVAEER